MIDRDTVIELARQAGFKCEVFYVDSSLEDVVTHGTEYPITDELERFANAVAQKAAEAEREACAQVAMLVASNGVETSATIRARGTASL